MKNTPSRKPTPEEISHIDELMESYFDKAVFEMSNMDEEGKRMDQKAAELFAEHHGCTAQSPTALMYLAFSWGFLAGLGVGIEHSGGIE